MHRIALAVALVAVPAPFRVAVTVHATVTTNFAASQSHLDPANGACGFVDIGGSSQLAMQLDTPTPVVLPASELTHAQPGRLTAGFTASVVSSGAFTETFTSPCADNVCTSLAYGWFSNMFPTGAQVPCDRPLASDESGCGATTVPVDVRNVYAQAHDSLFTKFDSGLFETGVVLDGRRPNAHCSAWWPFFHGFGNTMTLTMTALEKRLKRGPLVLQGSDIHTLPGDEGDVTQQSAWVIRLTRAR
jgi:hypothetical protein